MKNQVLTDFSNWRDADLDQVARTIAGAMRNNPFFPKLTEEAAAADKASAEFSEALLAAAMGSSRDRSIKEDKRKVLVKALRVLGAKINVDADGDRTKLESTGFPLAREGAPGGKGKKGISLEVGPNMVTVSFKGIKGAGAYLVHYTEAPVTAGSIWHQATTKWTHATISGLETGKKYAFKVAGIIDDQAPVFSEPVISRFIEGSLD